MAITSLSTYTANNFAPKRNNLTSSFVGNITYITSAKITTNNQTPPVGTQVGDFILVVGSADDNDIFKPSNFTLISQASPSSTNYTLSYKFWQTGDTTINTSNRSSDSVYGIYVFRNVGSLQINPPAPIFTRTDENTVTFPAITTTAVNSMVLRPAMIDEAAITGISYPSPWSVAPIYTVNPGAPNGQASVALAYLEVPTPTTLNQQTVQFQPTFNAGDNNGATLALIPSGA